MEMIDKTISQVLKSAGVQNFESLQLKNEKM